MVEDGKGCYVGVKHLRIMKVANPHVVYYGLDEDLDTTLSGLMCVCKLDLQCSESFPTSGLSSLGGSVLRAPRYCCY
jgi:hypothetical protein